MALSRRAASSPLPSTGGARLSAALLLSGLLLLPACGPAVASTAAAAPAPPASAATVAASASAPTPPAPRPDPQPRPAPKPDPEPIPILMYHVVGIRAADAPYPLLYVTPALFAAQMAALAKAGYRAVTLQEAYDAWTGRTDPPPHPIVISFDDGYVGQYDNALPVLNKLRWPGVLNLMTARIDAPGGLTDAQVRELIAAGWEIDDHTVAHPDLTTLTAPQVRAQVTGAESAIEQRFGVTPRFFCYPAGRYDPAVVAAVRQAGFLGATTTWPGDAYPPTEGMWTLNRVRVDGGESPARLLAVLKAYAASVPPAPPASFPARPSGQRA